MTRRHNLAMGLLVFFLCSGVFGTVAPGDFNKKNEKNNKKRALTARAKERHD